MKYILVKLEERNGEQEYTHNTVHQVADDTDISAFADDYAKRFYGSADEDEGGQGEKLSPEDEGYYFMGGALYVEVQDVREIPKKHYDILKLY